MVTILSPNRYDGRARPIRLVVIHTMEVAETSTVAEAVARNFQNPARRASAHVCSDNDSDVRCVYDDDTAWAAPGANADGLQLELAGRASQTPSQWADAYSKALLERGAKVTAAWCKRYGIPPRQLTNAQLADGRTKGIVTHNQVSQVFKLSSHWDPGLSFPMLSFTRLVAAIIGAKPPASSIPPLKAPVYPGVVLSLGAHGSSVRVVQNRLVALGHKLTPDAQFGPLTERAVRAFQSSRKLAVDGKVGRNTWAALWVR